MAKSVIALEQFKPIDGQPSGTDFTRIREVVAPLLLQIPYEKTGGTNNLIGIIWPGAAYKTRYGAAFVEPTRVGDYDAKIKDDATAVVRVCTEVAHKAKRADRGTYETTRQETDQFILPVIEYMWVWELQDTETSYTEVAQKAFLAHLQAGYTGRHAFDLLALHN